MKKLGLFISFVGTFLLANVSQASPLVFHTLQIAEVPVNASPAVMNGWVSIDLTTHEMIVDVTFSGLIGTVTASHIHCCTAAPVQNNPNLTAGVATALPTFFNFPGSLQNPGLFTSGTYHQAFNTLAASTWNPAFVTAHGGTTAGAEADFLTGLRTGGAYWNIHTTFAGGGEIRAAFVPEPASIALLGLGLLGVGLSRRKHAA
jgi:hypothetical protein